MLQCLSTADCRWCPDTAYAGRRGWGGTGSGELEQQQQHVGREVWWDAVGWVTGALGVAPVIAWSLADGGTLTAHGGQPSMTLSRYTEMSPCVCTAMAWQAVIQAATTPTAVLCLGQAFASQPIDSCRGGYYWVLRVDWCSGGAKHSTLAVITAAATLLPITLGNSILGPRVL